MTEISAKDKFISAERLSAGNRELLRQTASLLAATINPAMRAEYFAMMNSYAELIQTAASQALAQPETQPRQQPQATVDFVPVPPQSETPATISDPRNVAPWDPAQTAAPQESTVTTSDVSALDRYRANVEAARQYVPTPGEDFAPQSTAEPVRSASNSPEREAFIAQSLADVRNAHANHEAV